MLCMLEKMSPCCDGPLYLIILSFSGYARHWDLEYLFSPIFNFLVLVSICFCFDQFLKKCEQKAEFRINLVVSVWKRREGLGVRSNTLICSKPSSLLDSRANPVSSPADVRKTSWRHSTFTDIVTCAICQSDRDMSWESRHNLFVHSKLEILRGLYRSQVVPRASCKYVISDRNASWQKTVSSWWDA